MGSVTDGSVYQIGAESDRLGIIVIVINSVESILNLNISANSKSCKYVVLLVSLTAVKE